MTSNNERAVTVSPYRALADFKREERELVKEQIAVGATDRELDYFLTQCIHMGLNPFMGQVYWIKRRVKEDGEWKTRGVIQIGIDGFRAMAERSGEYAGQDEIEYGPDIPDGEHVVPEFATATIYRKSFDRPTRATAYWHEYAQRKQDGTLMARWGQMPRHMLGKCAEALGLRKSNPQVFGGLFIGEELEKGLAETALEAAGPPKPHLGPPPEATPGPPEAEGAPAVTGDTPGQRGGPPAPKGGDEREDPRAAVDPPVALDPPQCPKHHKPWREGKDGALFCTAKDENGRNGYCDERPSVGTKQGELV